MTSRAPPLLLSLPPHALPGQIQSPGNHSGRFEKNVVTEFHQCHEESKINFFRFADLNPASVFEKEIRLGGQDQYSRGKGPSLYDSREHGAQFTVGVGRDRVLLVGAGRQGSHDPTRGQCGAVNECGSDQTPATAVECGGGEYGLEPGR